MTQPDHDTEHGETALATELIEGGSDLAGAAAGAAIGLIGGPLGAVGGAATGAVLARVLRHVGSDLKQRLLGPREEVRVGAAAAYAGATIKALLDIGEHPREDEFFAAQEGGQRPPAEELLEGVLLKARDAYEEKKVKYLGTLFALVAFRAEISPAHANHLLGVASRLTYRQLVVLAVATDDGGRTRLRDSSYRSDDQATQALGVEGVGLITEIYDLYQQGLLNDATGSAWISVRDVHPAAMRPQGSGHLLALLMGLAAIPHEDREDVYRLLARDR